MFQVISERDPVITGCAVFDGIEPEAERIKNISFINRDSLMTEPQATAPKAEPQKEKVGIGAYIALALVVILFSGVFYKMPAG